MFTIHNDNTSGALNPFSEFVSTSPDDTFSIGKKLAGLLLPGSIVALQGVLGSGKTQLAKGIAAGLGITENLTSPTYTIVNEYALQMSNEQLAASGEITFYHIDVYRLEGDKNFEDIGGEEILNSNGICVVEWSEKIYKMLPDDCVTVSIEITGEESRVIRISNV